MRARSTLWAALSAAVLLAALLARVIAAWEDERDGPTQIYAARAGLRRLR